MDSKLITASALAGLIIAGSVAAATVSAQTAATETGLTKDQIIAIALAEMPGEVREIELEWEDGMRVYELEILSDDGIETDMDIAAETGEILEIEAEEDKDRAAGRDA